MTEPLLRRLSARGEVMTVAALPWVAPVYRAMPQVAEVVDLPFQHGQLQWRERHALGKAWRDRFDVAYVLPNSLKSALLPFLARIPERVGYLGETRVGLLTHRLKNPKGKPPMVAFYSALAGESGVESDRPQLRVRPEETEAVLAEFDLLAGAYYVAAPGAEYGPAKCWPAEHYAALAARLDAPVVLLGSGKEAALCEDIAARSRALGARDGSGAEVRVLAGKTRLSQALALIGAARGMISNDSGLMHVAAAFGRPQVAVFGSTSPVHTPPLNSKAQVIWLRQEPEWASDLACSPCFERTCPLGHLRCLQEVSPDRVVRALVESEAQEKKQPPEGG